MFQKIKYRSSPIIYLFVGTLNNEIFIFKELPYAVLYLPDGEWSLITVVYGYGNHTIAPLSIVEDSFQTFL